MSESWLFILDHAPVLETKIMTKGSSAPLDSVYRIVYMLKQVYIFKLVYSFNVVHRCDKASIIALSLVLQYLCHSSN
jgi:hypothetical protein